MYFNIEISILDQYTVECEVHVLVFINYWIEKFTVKHWNTSIQLGAQFIPSIFFNLYMLRATMCPSSGETTVFCDTLYLLFCMDNCTKYQMWHKHSFFSWWCAQSRSKHVEIDRYTKNNFHICTVQLNANKVFYLSTDAQWICFKRILKFTLKQLLHVSVQSPSSGSVLFELAKVIVIKIIG